MELSEPFLHISHENVLSPLCSPRCPFRWESCAKDYSHISHENGRSPLRILRCVFSLERLANFFLHISQENGRSPLWLLSCVFRLQSLANDFLHTSQENGRCELLIPRYVFRWKRLANAFLHTLHEKGRSPIWILKCPFILERRANIFLHTSHEKARTPLWTLRCVLGWSAVRTISYTLPYKMAVLQWALLYGLYKLERLVNFLQYLQEKDFLRPLDPCTALCLGVNNVTHISHRVGVVLIPLACPIKLFPRDNDFLHISQESKFSSQINNSAPCCRRISLPLTLSCGFNICWI
jgi:hypothetical protein